MDAGCTNDQPLLVSERYTYSVDGCVQTLTIADLTLIDQGKYTYSIENVSTDATLFVGGKPLSAIFMNMLLQLTE